MAYINLLPWREEAQKAKEKEFFIILGGIALCALAIVIVVNQFYLMRIDGQNTRNQFITSEIQLLDKKIIEIKELKKKKADLYKRISLVQQLQKSRNVGTQVLDEITSIVPNGVYLVSLKKQSNILAIEGKSESNNHLANMMRDVETSNFLADAQIDTISSKDTQSRLLSDFKMNVRIEGLVSDVELKKARKKSGRK